MSTINAPTLYWIWLIDFFFTDENCIMINICYTCPKYQHSKLPKPKPRTNISKEKRKDNLSDSKPYFPNDSYVNYQPKIINMKKKSSTNASAQSNVANLAPKIQRFPNGGK